MTAEQRFKRAVRSLWARGIYPSPTALNQRLGKSRGPLNNLGGCRPRWRCEVMVELGIPLQRKPRKPEAVAVTELKDTGDVTRAFCPGCEPETSLRSLVRVAWCDAHRPMVAGSDDHRLGSSIWSLPRSGSAEADGTDCRLMAEALGRPR